jgi:tetratricopeptide (TPR) repeat protein
LAAFLNDQHGRVVTIQGEAGMGKSRLVSEWLSVIVPDQATVWQGRGLPYSQGVGYGVFRSLLQDALRTFPPQTAWDDKITPSLRPFLRQVMGSTLTPEEQTSLRYLEPERIKQLTELAMREWLLEETRQRSIVLILEDFHWADDLSKDMLPSLIGLVREAPLLLCLISRPQPEAPLQIAFPQTKAPLAAPLFLSIELKPLSTEHSRALLGHLVNLNSLPEQFVNTILTRAEGNPFYIEEFVHMLIEKQVLTQGDDQWQVASTVELETLEVPTTLRGLMMARVDRLPQDLQHVLRDAAVIGLQFSASLLDEVERRLHGTVNVLPMLERLTQMGLLVKRPGAGEPMHGFRHIITQETIYDGLMHSQRPGLHRAVAECIETLYADDVNSQAEVLALHYHRAHVRDKAMRYALQAGDRARQRFANHEAVEHYSLALQLSQHLSSCEAERWQAAIGLGEVQQHIGQYEEATALYRAALEEWKEAIPEARAQVMLKLGQVWDKQGDTSEAEGWLRQALTHLSRAGVPHPELQAQIYSELGWLSLRRGDLVAAQDWLEQGLALVSDTEHYDVLSSILNRLGAVHFNRSEWERAAKCVERALELRQRLGDVVGYARSLNNLGILKQASGDWDGALADYERSVESNERIGEVEGLALACTNLGVLYTDRGEWAKAEENLLRSFAIAQQIAHSYELAQAHMNLGGLYLLQERWADCARHLDAVLPLYEQVGARANLNLNDAYDLQSRLALEQGQLDTALEWARRSRDLLRQVTEMDDGESVEWGRYEQLMGRIAQAQGNLTTARHHLEKSAAIFGQAHSQLDAGRTAYWSARLSLEMHQSDQARDKLNLARQIFEQLGAAADLQRVQHLTQLAKSSD